MRALLIAFFLLFSQQYVMAEHGEGGRHGGRMLEKLELTAEQAEAFKEIMQTQKDKRRAIFEEYRKEMKGRMQELHGETRDKVAGILSEEQLARFDEIHAQRMQKMQERMKKRHEKHRQSGHRHGMKSDGGNS